MGVQCKKCVQTGGINENTCQGRSYTVRGEGKAVVVVESQAQVKTGDIDC